MEDIELIDIADDLLIVNKTTIDRLFQEENQNTLILYLFYYKTAKWQKHNPIKANDDYCKRCLHWGIDRLQLAKKRLKEMNLIEVIKRTTDEGKVQGWYVKVNYLIDETTIPKTTIPIKPQLVCQETNTINNNILNTNNNKNINTNNNTLFDLLQENGFSITPLQYEVVSGWSDNDLTRYAIKKAVLNNKFNINYINKILFSYEKENIKTVEQAIAKDEEFNNKRDSYFKNKYEHKETRYEREQRIMKEWLERNE